jgi:quercetin dioxygenase-like cupin family protein
MNSMQWSLRSRLLIALTLAAIVAVTAAAQERGAKPPVPAPATNPNAVGLVAFHPTEGMTTSRIRYEAGARTNWHTHTAPQMLWVEDGRGLWQERGDPVKEMVKDVPVVTRANVTHWHGAPANSHSVQLTVYGGTITWGAPVTDAEYQGKK